LWWLRRPLASPQVSSSPEKTRNPRVLRPYLIELRVPPAPVTVWNDKVNARNPGECRAFIALGCLEGDFKDFTPLGSCNAATTGRAPQHSPPR